MNLLYHQRSDSPAHPPDLIDPHLSFQLWFALDNGFSGQILFDKWCIGIYNVVSYRLSFLARSSHRHC